MYALYILGNLLEPAIGHVRFALIYVVALLAGSFGALIVTPDSFTVGASAAVFGLFGAAIRGLRFGPGVRDSRSCQADRILERELQRIEGNQDRR